MIGRLLASGLGAFVGRARLLVPPLTIFAGWHLLRTEPKKRSEYRPRLELAAFGFAFVALFSALDMLGGRPGWGSSNGFLSKSGGWFGIATGGSIERYFGYWGQLIVTVAMSLMAVVLLTSLSTVPIADFIADLASRIRERFDEWREQQRSDEPQVEEPKAKGRQVTDMPILDLEHPPEPSAFADAGTGSDEIFDQETYIDLRVPGTSQPRDDATIAEVAARNRRPNTQPRSSRSP